MEYTRLLKRGVVGDDVKAVKDKLVALGYLKRATHDKFYRDTQAAVKQYQSDKGLKVDGIVGMLTWNSLFGSSETGSGSTVQWTRDLSKGMSGDDCKALKDRLVDLGYLHASTKKTLGNDSDRAIRAFKSANGLDGSNGIVDLETWNAIFSDSATVPEIVDVDVSEIPPNIGSCAAKQIAAALKGVSQVRKDMVLDVLQYAVDPEALPSYPFKFYIRGGNLYNKDLTLNVMTRSKLNSYLSNPNYEIYYSGGRDDMMREASEQSDYNTPGDDCSGECVGLLRKHCNDTSKDGVKKAVSSGFDANANTLYSKYCTPTSNPKPGDMIHKDGHAGIFVGAGYAVESAGGAYGTALSVVSNRRIYSFIDHRMHKMGGWEHYGKWVFLND